MVVIFLLLQRYYAKEVKENSSKYRATVNAIWRSARFPGGKGFDPTGGEIAGSRHIAVAVARRPEVVSPVTGTFIGPPGSSLTVGVWVSAL